MKLSDLISMCIRNLTRRKVRTLLTVVGVVVGTCSIVVMISIGIGMKKSQEEMLSQMGDLTVIEVYNYGASKDGKAIYLTDKTMEEISKVNGVIIATPFYRPHDINLELFAGKNDRYESYMNVTGVYPEALKALGYDLMEGDYETAFAEPYSMVFGQYAAYNFRDTRKRPGYDMAYPYPDQNGEIEPPLFDINREKMLLRTGTQKEGAKALEFKAKVTAVMKENWGKGYETSRGVFMDINDLKKIVADYNKENGIKIKEDKGYENVKVKVADIKYVAAVEEAIQDMGFETYSMETIRKPMEEQAKKQQMILGSLGAISLFVAAIGITNTMVMSIYERTREIGIMKVVGCFVGDIRSVFLMEAGTIGFCGGVAGVLLSYFISFLMNYFGFSFSMDSMAAFFGEGTGATQVSIIPAWLVALALIFSTCIGLISGYYPANRAVKISALTAIKQE